MNLSEKPKRELIDIRSYSASGIQAFRVKRSIELGYRKMTRTEISPLSANNLQNIIIHKSLEHNFERSMLLDQKCAGCILTYDLLRLMCCGFPS